MGAIPVEGAGEVVIAAEIQKCILAQGEFEAAAGDGAGGRIGGFTCRGLEEDWGVSLSLGCSGKGNGENAQKEGAAHWVLREADWGFGDVL